MEVKLPKAVSKFKGHPMMDSAKKHRIFAPLAKWEDKQRSFWFVLGASTVMLVNILLANF